MLQNRENRMQIHEAIIAVMRDVGAIGKDATNKEQHFNYRSAEQIYNRVAPLFATHGIFTVPNVVAQEHKDGASRSGGVLRLATLTVSYTFFATDGSSVECTVIGQGMDSGDKAVAKAMTAAHKTALTQILSIPFAVVDPDEFTPDWARPLTGGITEGQYTALKLAWRDKCAPDEKDKDKLGKMFREWAGALISRDTSAGDWKTWWDDDLQACCKALD